MEQCIFCKIAKGEIPSYKIFENEEVVIVLDINPASKGHCLIISKHHEKIPTSLGEVLIKLLKLKDKLKFKAYILIKKAEIEHFVLQFIPIYTGNEAICQVNNKQGKKEELELLVKELTIKEEKVINKNDENVIEIKEPEEIEIKRKWYINP